MVAPRPGWQFTWENDSVIGPYGTDVFYTQGLQFGYRFKADAQPAFLSRPIEAICRKLNELSAPSNRQLGSAASLFVGQHLFTPEDITIPALIPDDRPYAAWLYVGARLEVAQRFAKPRRLAQTGLFHTFELQLGTTGKPALGEWVQKNWHELLVDSPEPKGWDNQLPTEVGLQGRYAVRGLLAQWPEEDSNDDVVRWHNWQIQATVDGGLSLGSILASSSVGTTWRIGRNLGDPVAERLSPAFKRPGIEGPPCWRWIALQECYLFAGVTGHAVAFNAFLDGMPFGGGHSVDKEELIYDLSVGARARWRAFQIDYTVTWTSREFHPVPRWALNPDGRHGFGALNLRCVAPMDAKDKRTDLVCPWIVNALIFAIAAQ